MATDFYPEGPVWFDNLLDLIEEDGGRRGLVVEPQPDDLRVTITLDGRNFLHAHRTQDNYTVFSRYGDNDVEPILRHLDVLLGVRIGPEHERED